MNTQPDIRTINGKKVFFYNPEQLEEIKNNKPLTEEEINRYRSRQSHHLLRMEGNNITASKRQPKGLRE